MKNFLDKLKLRHKKVLLIFLDVIFVNFFYGFAFLLLEQRNEINIWGFVLATCTYLFFFYVFKLYDSLWKFAGSYEFLNVIMANACATLTFNVLKIILLKQGLNFTRAVIFSLFTVTLTFSSRMFYRFLRRYMIFLQTKSMNSCLIPKKVMIIGAGYTGSLIIKEMLSNVHLGYSPQAVIDDNRSKWGSYINKVKVVGGRNQIRNYVKKENIEIIVIAIAKISQKEKVEIINICKETGCELKIIPAYNEILNDDVFLSKMRDVAVEDLLGRDTVQLDMEGISVYLENRVVLVTGGGGSIGSELCRQISKFKPKQLLVLDIYENNAYDLQNELKTLFPNLNLTVLIASIRDKKRLEAIFAKFKPEVVFHAAAHKHVPLMEESPGEAIKNNVFGTLNLVECADKHGVDRFVQISTDKAVNPTNVMGATKRICEMIIQAIDKTSETKFVAVRFGNVLGSNGSVIPLFKKQIAAGGPVTLTHKDITRFFMTIPEAAQLVLQAGAFAGGGEIFVLDMGKPVKIYDLASDLIKLSGFEPEKEVKIEITGLRPGEKLYEELLMDEEDLGKTKHEKIFIGQPADISFEKLKNKLGGVRLLLEAEDDEMVFAVVRDLVPTYCSRNGSSDEVIEKEIKEIIDTKQEAAVSML
ncbi:polysaccharide biosynthesis protein [Clostridium grantii]|uniref:NDP-sugar epimerase, includes UDP-GlcNAc-inverting 4,6-dehydratase FlaA1 and capsular polysaccharide biosynthesis protein EpsC n=1 Tax=Clostridium grantii DSM 8605 TaxID=1121316 RepID=A0A1M5T832_9CLOT|nr:nucleoside-diphosphate sugar epimerase/dehydratase [Clostridium grantii]SHH46881.1 NDP-sugar epimerase, includes UDP-GlcNAc-inverting 4,6-dehydratase FlaA1 and capsular polysaccharide biosynthesis protein EpsC [Clostridium grantii DSM 8605]